MASLAIDHSRIDQARHLNDTLRRSPQFCSFGSIRIAPELMAEINAKPTRIARLAAQGELFRKLRDWTPDASADSDPFHQSGSFEWNGQTVLFQILDETRHRPISQHPNSHCEDTWRVINVEPQWTALQSDGEACPACKSEVTDYLARRSYSRFRGRWIMDIRALQCRSCGHREDDFVQ